MTVLLGIFFVPRTSVESGLGRISILVAARTLVRLVLRDYIDARL